MGYLDLTGVLADAVVYAHSASPVQNRPYAPGFIGARIRARLVGRLDSQPVLRGVLRAQRRKWLEAHAQELLDRQLGVRVAALTVVVVEQPRSSVEQITRRPALVLVLLPQLQLAVDQHRVLDAQAGDSVPDRSLVARRVKAGAVHADHAQASLPIALVPSPHIRQRAQRVGATEVPELHQH